MAQENKVDSNGAHDRVVMLSLAADGTPAQNKPEIIGDKDAALEAAKEQFRQQAVSAADIAVRGVTAGGVAGTPSTKEDPQVAELKKAHEAAEKAGESAAESVVKSLHE